MPPSFAADLAITSDTSLDADTTVDALTIAPGVTLDLNGHDLAVSSLAGGGNSLIGGRYQILGYVTADRTQYVQTDYTPIASDRAEMKFRFTDGSTSVQALFCTRLPDSQQSFTFLRLKSGSSTTYGRIDHGSNQSGTVNFAIKDNKDFVFTLDGATGVGSARNLTDGTVTDKSVTAAPLSSPPGPFILLSGGNYASDGSGTFNEVSSYRSKGRFYWFKVNGRDGALKCLIVPAKDTQGTDDESDDVIGMYNLVSGTFLAPAVGTFTDCGGEYSGEGGRIVNTSATLSELRVNVPDGAATTNDSVEVAGNVKLVKDGGGTFIASRLGQSYGGGTDVADGILVAGAYGDRQPFGLCEDNLLFNGSFDAGSITNGTAWQYSSSVAWPENPGWTCDGKNEGICTPDSAGTWVLSSIDVGKYAIYLRSQTESHGEANVEQTFRVRSPGRHRFSFAYMGPNRDDRKNGTLSARLIHGGTTNLLCTFSVPSSSRRAVFSRIVEIDEAGEYTLQFNLAAEANYKAVSIDDVEFSPVLEELNLIKNGTFDEGDIGSAGFLYASGMEWTECPYWTCDGGNVGLSTDDGTWLIVGSRIGKYAAYLRTTSGCAEEGAWFEQTVTVADPGRYAIRFSCALCANTSRRGQPVNVYLNHGGRTNLLMSVTATVESLRCFGTYVDILETGDYTLRFQQDRTSDVRSSNIDDVHFSKVPSVVVRSGAAFDVAGARSYGKYPLVMDGGTFVNSGARGGQAVADSLLGTVLLSADSLFAITNAYAMRAYSYGTVKQSYIDLGGHELEIRLAADSFYVEKCTMTNGSVRVSENASEKYFCFINGDSVAMDVDMSLMTCYAASSVAGLRNLTFSDPDGTHHESGTLGVSGTFKTLMDKFPNVKLADGATLDLSENTGTFSLDGTKDSRKVSFANGATIALRLGGRRAPSRIVGWTTAPSNLDTLTFVPAADDIGGHYSIVKKSDGLYIRAGFMMIVR